LWGRVQAHDANDNLFFVQLDDELDNLWEIETGDAWHWDAVNNRDIADPARFMLEAGQHTIRIKLGEDVTKLDKMLLTNDVNFVPTGEGGAAANQVYP